MSTKISESAKKTWIIIGIVFGLYILYVAVSGSQASGHSSSYYTDEMARDRHEREAQEASDAADEAARAGDVDRARMYGTQSQDANSAKWSAQESMDKR